MLYFKCFFLIFSQIQKMAQAGRWEGSGIEKVKDWWWLLSPRAGHRNWPKKFKIVETLELHTVYLHLVSTTTPY
jgi:hypothetical protein